MICQSKMLCGIALLHLYIFFFDIMFSWCFYYVYFCLILCFVIFVCILCLMWYYAAFWCNKWLWFRLHSLLIPCFFVCIRYIFLVFFGSCVFCELTQLIGCLRFLAAHLAWFDWNDNRLFVRQINEGCRYYSVSEEDNIRLFVRQINEGCRYHSVSVEDKFMVDCSVM